MGLNVLCLDQTGSFVDFALRVRAAGHYPKVCMGRDKETHQRTKTGDGLVEKIEGEEWQRHMKWADLVITSDNTRWLRELDLFRRKGFPIFAPSAESAELELDRECGQKAFMHAGIKVIEWEQFSDYAKAEKYVLAEGKRFVSKPMGDKDKALSYVSQSPRDMLFMLRRWRELNKEKPSFILQEFVAGTEIAVTGWMGKNGFSKWVCENFEFKKFMNDDKGPNTGEQGTLMRYTDDSALAKEVLFPLERELMRLGHTGAIDVAVIVDEGGTPRPLEFTARLSWPGFNIMQQLHPDPCEWMCELVDGVDGFRPLQDIVAGVVCTLPPWPREKVEMRDVTGIPLYGLDDENEFRDYISPCEVQSGVAPDDQGVDQKVMVSTGCYLMVASGCGDTVREAKSNAYMAAESVEIPNSVQMRTDIGDRCEDDLKTLKDCGFCQDWRY